MQTKTLPTSPSRSANLFGSPLAEVVEAQPSEWNLTIPFIISQTTDYLKEKASSAGIFRVASDKVKVKDLKNEFEKAFKEGKLVEQTSLSDIHATAALLKLYFYYLPKPLLLPDDNFYDLWISAIRIDNSLELAERIRENISSLPTVNRHVLDILMNFLSVIASYSNVNKMTASNLAVIFGSILLPPKKSSDSSLSVAIVKKLIEELGQQKSTSSNVKSMSRSESRVDSDNNSSRSMSRSSSIVSKTEDRGMTKSGSVSSTTSNTSNNASDNVMTPRSILRKKINGVGDSLKKSISTSSNSTPLASTSTTSMTPGREDSTVPESLYKRTKEQLHMLEDKYKTLEGRYKEQESALISYQKNATLEKDHKNAVITLEQQLKTSEKRATEAEKKVIDLERKALERENTLSLLKQNGEALTKKIRELDAELQRSSKADNKDVKEKDKSILQLQQSVARYDKDLKESEKSITYLQIKIKENDKLVKDRDTTIQTLNEEIKAKDKRIKELEKLVGVAQNSSLDNEKELAAAASKYQKEIEKIHFLYKEKTSVATSRLEAAEVDLRKKQTEIERIQEALKASKIETKSTTERLLKEQQDKEKLYQAIHQNSQQIQNLEKFKQDYANLETAYKEEQLLRKKYFNMMEESKGNIRVYCRIRPISNEELRLGASQSIDVHDMYTLKVESKNGLKQFEYSKVFSPSSTQSQVFEDVSHLVQSTIDGYNVCIFAYGQTGSGKTYTMIGSDNNPQHIGIAPRAIHDLFHLLKLNHTKLDFKIQCYMVELYNDNLIDLLSDQSLKQQLNNAKINNEKLAIKKDAKGMVYIQNITLHLAKTPQDLENIMRLGFSKRRTEETNMNEHSSRSHLIFSIFVETTNLQTKQVTVGKLSLVDLAGSERVNRSGVSEDRLKEAQNINKSLTALGHVISSLSSSESHIPYRNNKLTLLMSDSLGGNAKTLMFVCVSPTNTNVEESLNSLSYASRAKSVVNNATKNISSNAKNEDNNNNNDDIQSLSQELEEEKQLRSDAESKLITLQNKIQLLESQQQQQQLKQVNNEKKEKEVTPDIISTKTLDLNKANKDDNNNNNKVSHQLQTSQSTPIKPLIIENIQPPFVHTQQTTITNTKPPAAIENNKPIISTPIIPTTPEIKTSTSAMSLSTTSISTPLSSNIQNSSCSKCGKSSTGRFCIYCGSPLKTSNNDSKSQPTPSNKIENTTALEEDNTSSLISNVPTSSSERLTTTRKPSITGRRAPSKSALTNKNTLESNAVAIAATNPQHNNTSNKPQQTPKQNSIGSFGLLASLGVNKDTKFTLNSTGNAKPIDDLLQPDKENKLIQIKGRRKVKVRQVELSYKSLNSGDVFILDLFDKLFVWNGSKSNRMEKAKALDVATRIKDKDRNTRATIVTIEEGSEPIEFWEPLGGKHQIASMEQALQDEETDNEVLEVLYRVQENSGTLEAIKVDVDNNTRLTRELVDTNYTYIVDANSEFYLWQGKGFPSNRKKDSLQLAKDIFISMKGRPSWTKIARIFEGTEPVLFKEKFSNWPDKLPIQVATIPKGNVASKQDIKLDFVKLHTPVILEEKPVDDGKGKVTIWQIQEFEKVLIPQEEYGIFYSGCSYIILYTYMQKWKECYIIYFWQGRNSSINEKGTSAILTIDLDDKVTSGAATQVRVVQNQEPQHFLQVFQNKFIVKKGDGTTTSTTSLYHITTRKGISYPIEVNLRSSALNSNDSFVLLTNNCTYIWNGRSSSDGKKAAASLVASNISKKSAQSISEGKEPSEFWTLLGGKSKYCEDIITKPARLFQCSTSTGSFRVDEIPYYCQDSLDNNDMMILDANTKIFVWMGLKATEEEKRKTMETAVLYLESDPNKRSKENTQLYYITAFQEPLPFVTYFHGWDDSKNKDYLFKELTLVKDKYSDYTRSYSIEELRTKPPQLDHTVLEQYLSDSDFQHYFGMNKTDFKQLNKWKAETMKKGVGLY